MFQNVYPRARPKGKQTKCSWTNKSALWMVNNPSAQCVGGDAETKRAREQCTWLIGLRRISRVTLVRAHHLLPTLLLTVSSQPFWGRGRVLWCALWSLWDVDENRRENQYINVMSKENLLSDVRYFLLSGGFLTKILAKFLFNALRWSRVSSLLESRLSSVYFLIRVGFGVYSFIIIRIWSGCVLEFTQAVLRDV